jgi:malate dehydrogenase (oxaloacetate-decarboxylating)
MQPTDGIQYRRKNRGLIGIDPKVPVRDRQTLSVVYTPGVAQPCLEIAKNHLMSFDYTIRGNTVAIVSDGSSVYGLGNVGPYAAIPMLEAKSVFHKTFAGVDGFPIALATQDVDEIVEIIRYLSPTFGGIHLEDIASPNCFAIEERLKRAVSLPILHADQQGAAIAVLAALTNALKIVDKKLENLKLVIDGAGAAGVATAKMLHKMGVEDITVCDSHGAIHYRRYEGLNWVKSEVARMTSKMAAQGSLQDVIKGADAFVGFSRNGRLTPAMIQSMAKDPIVFALSVPTPEIDYHAAREAGAKVVATGGSNTPNQVNSSLVSPGLFRGALDVRAKEFNHAMFVAAAQAMASLVDDNELAQGTVIPQALDYRVSARMAKAVAQAAMDTGVSQVTIDADTVEDRVMKYVYEGASAWVEPPSPQHGHQSVDDESLELHKRYHGMVEIKAHVPIRDHYMYNLIYSAPGAAEPCKMIHEDPEQAYDLTFKNNLVGIVTDGSAVLGLGNIGPGAGMPVMEGKAVLFKTFGGVEAFPICLRTQEIDEIVEAVQAIAPVFGGINLEDIAAPRCFDIERILTETMDIPIFHDDQHGTAVVVVAAVLNAVKCVDKPLDSIRIVVNGAGASALSVSRLLLKAGVKDIVICDTKGVIYKGRKDGMNPFKQQIAEITNLGKAKGSLLDVFTGADMFLGLSAPNTVTPEMVRTMAPDPIIFALANPMPEIMPDLAREAGAKVIATGRSDFPNQVNNSLAFPGIFRGALDTRAKTINDDMKLAAAYAISHMVTQNELDEATVIPGAFDLRVPPAVAGAVAAAAMKSGVARTEVNPDTVTRQLSQYLYEGQLGKVQAEHALV